MGLRTGNLITLCVMILRIQNALHDKAPVWFRIYNDIEDNRAGLFNLPLMISWKLVFNCDYSFRIKTENWLCYVNQYENCNDMNNKGNGLLGSQHIYFIHIYKDSNAYN